MAIRITKIKTRSNLLELKVLAEISQYIEFETLDQFKNAFEYAIPRIKTGNHANTEGSYKIKEENGCLKLWKQHASGGDQRLVLTVEQL